MTAKQKCILYKNNNKKKKSSDPANDRIYNGTWVVNNIIIIIIHKIVFEAFPPVTPDIISYEKLTGLPKDPYR